jgi:NitT/TauT family transport system substrate-binding protein
MPKLNRRAFLILSGGSLIAVACGGGGSDSNATSSSGSSSGSNGPDNSPLRLGYFPNMTHVQPNVGIQNGAFQKQLGEGVKLTTKAFNAGPSAIEALFAGEVDATYVGPSPALNGFVQSNGKDVRIVAGATSGGALFVTRRGFEPKAPSEFANKKIASPQLGNTQDVALRAWLKKNGLNAKEQGGNVTVVPTPNAQQIQLLQQGQVDAAWAPEPWGTRLLQEGGAKLYLDERDLWPNKQFVTTNLVVKTSYLNAHPQIIENLLRAHVDITDYIKSNAAEAKRLLNAQILKETHAALPENVMDAAWSNQDITFDPLASSVQKAANDAYELGFFDKKPDLGNLYDLKLLNKILAEKNLPAVKGFT